MRAAIRDAWRVIVPPAGDPDGSLPPLLLALTVVTGLVDAFSYLVLVHVFVANMTGNVVFLGFALAGAGGFSIPASLLALGAFALGAVWGGRLGIHLGGNRARLIAAASVIEAVLVAASLVVATTAGASGSGVPRYVLIVLLGLTMGGERSRSQAGGSRSHHLPVDPHDHRNLRWWSPCRRAIFEGRTEASLTARHVRRRPRRCLSRPSSQCFTRHRRGAHLDLPRRRVGRHAGSQNSGGEEIA